MEVEKEQETKVIVHVDSQIVNSIGLCGERYRLEHVLNRRPLGKAEALERGSVMHTMFAHYYRGRKDGRTNPENHAKLINECVMLGREEAASASFDMGQFENEDLNTFRDNILHHQYDGWEILGVEEPFTKLLYDSEDLTILYEGIVDLRVKTPKEGEAVVDHKTESRKSYPFELSNQFQGYQWAFDAPIIINKIGFQKTLPPEEKFRRLHFPYKEALIQEWKTDVVDHIRMAMKWHKDNYFPRNRTSCDKYSGCIFQRVCKEAPEMREFRLDQFYIQSDPWDVFTRDND
jgi:RecB family exonuclease